VQAALRYRQLAHEGNLTPVPAPDNALDGQPDSAAERLRHMYGIFETDESDSDTESEPSGAIVAAIANAFADEAILVEQPHPVILEASPARAVRFDVPLALPAGQLVLAPAAPPVAVVGDDQNIAIATPRPAGAPAARPVAVIDLTTPVAVTTPSVVAASPPVPGRVKHGWEPVKLPKLSAKFKEFGITKQDRRVIKSIFKAGPTVTASGLMAPLMAYAASARIPAHEMAEIYQAGLHDFADYILV
jgi:hypothetical protein